MASGLPAAAKVWDACTPANTCPYNQPSRLCLTPTALILAATEAWQNSGRELEGVSSGQLPKA